MDEQTDVDGTLLRRARARELMAIACEMVLLGADHGLCDFAIVGAIEGAAKRTMSGEEAPDRSMLTHLASLCRSCARDERDALPPDFWLARAALFEKAALVISTDEKLAA